MSILREIQISVVQDDSDIGSILLKLRLLASRLGSNPLEEWVKFESEGYPSNFEVPSYRVIAVSYTGTFSGPFGSGIKNAPIPPYLIEKFAGKNWTNYKIRESIAAVDELTKGSNDLSLGIDASNLILLLQGKIYPDYTCVSINGHISRSSLANIQYSVRSRILDLTVELEKSIPEIANINLEHPSSKSIQDSDTVNQISQQIIYGDVTTITSGDSSQIFISLKERDDKGLIKYLIASGLPESDANELVSILANEEPAGKDEPFGPRAKNWLLDNLKKAANGTWKIGISIATKIITEAALKYYGFK